MNGAALDMPTLTVAKEVPPALVNALQKLRGMA